MPKLAALARRALEGAGITRLEQMAKINEKELLKLHGMGPNALKTLKAALGEKGLEFQKEQ
ncbi:MAG TPA: hypothetical protein VMT46_05685 [Anaerolineaceae bacterium]|nr:hypothetical protein [Anaerolineaceae bacterium]